MVSQESKEDEFVPTGQSQVEVAQAVQGPMEPPGPTLAPSPPPDLSQAPCPASSFKACS